MKKQRYLRIFDYLREFSKIRTKPVRDIEGSANYHATIWLNDIPEDFLNENILRSGFDRTQKEYWLKIKKPKEPVPPRFGNLPPELEPWVDASSLQDESKGPTIYDSIVAEGATLLLNDFPQIKDAFTRYVDGQWLDDLIAYQPAMERYRTEKGRYDRTHAFYTKLFRIFNKIQQQGEAFELVIGVGLLNFKDVRGTKVFRHLVTQGVDIDFDYLNRDTEITVTPGTTHGPKVETEAILDLVETFHPQNVNRAGKAAADHFQSEAFEDIFSGGMHKILEKFAESIHPQGVYLDSAGKPGPAPSLPMVTFSPALLLRMRNTRGLTTMYEDILADLSAAGDDLDIPAINDLIGYDDADGEKSVGEPGPSNGQAEDLAFFFPKEYNEEQKRIIEKVRRNNKVLVQGPPGTGKSHTIANLICHLLADGNRLLITAQTTRALEVLKDKLPTQFRDLTVNLLGGDAAYMSELNASVSTIIAELDNPDVPAYRERIIAVEADLARIREEQALLRSLLARSRYETTETRTFNEQYAGTLLEIAEALERDTAAHQWYRDNFGEADGEEVISRLRTLIPLHGAFRQTPRALLEAELPNIAGLPSPDLLQAYVSLAEALASPRFRHVAERIIECTDHDQALKHLSDLEATYRKLENIQLDFLSDVTRDVAAGTAFRWRHKLQQSAECFRRLNPAELRKVDRDLEIVYPAGKGRRILKHDAKILLRYLQQGNELRGMLFPLKKAFLSQEIREKLYFIREVKVNGSDCDTEAEFMTVLQHLEIMETLSEIADIWQTSVPARQQLARQYEELHDLQSKVELALRLLEEAADLKQHIRQDRELRFEPLEPEVLADLQARIEYSLVQDKMTACQKQLDQAISYLDRPSLHPIKAELQAAYRHPHPNRYRELMEELAKLRQDQQRYRDYRETWDWLSDKIPATLAEVEAGSFLEKDIARLREAMLYRHAKDRLTRWQEEKEEQPMVRRLTTLEQEERLLIGTLAARKAWVHLVERLQQNGNLRQHLQAWLMAMQRIGKTGKGLRAQRFRKQAQQEMEHCKESIPCWIMPLYKVVETIRPKQGMYDYVIIDEASQLGPDAIFLRYISRNIIIIGDDKQTAPVYVGVDSAHITHHIRNYLHNIPFNQYYGLEFSFFDHARLFCEQAIVLSEHFRCMPEIINFSSRHFYEPNGIRLYPLRQYGRDRLDPLVTVFCPEGYTGGTTGAQIRNIPEAERIVATIAGMINDPRYENKTIGVISLQGIQQAHDIENRLEAAIGEQEINERKIVCGDSASFQGDERDIILLSLVTAPDHQRAALTKTEDERRFNVAVSRARDQAWLFHSVPLQELRPHDLRHKLLDHFLNYRKPAFSASTVVPRESGPVPKPFESWFEVDVHNDLVRKGLQVSPQYEVANGRYRIDLVLFLRDGSRIAIECDGDKWHGPEQFEAAHMRQRTLERCGWQFFRIAGHEYYTNREQALEPLWRLMPSQDDDDEEEEEENKDPDAPTPVIALPQAPVGSDPADGTPPSEPKTSVPTTGPDPVPPPAAPEPTIPGVMPPHRPANPPEPVQTDPNRVLRYLNLFSSGNYILTKDNPRKADHVVPIPASHRNGFLLQCYSSGHVNKVHISTLLIKKIDREYKNGCHAHGRLTAIHVIKAEKILGIFFREDGVRKFKAHNTKTLSTRELLHLQGMKVIYNDFTDIGYEILPLEMNGVLKRLVYKSLTSEGKPLDNDYYDEEWTALRTAVPDRFREPVRHAVPMAPLRKAGLKSLVKVKFLDTGRELLVRLVDYMPGPQANRDGATDVYFMAPLGQAISGKNAGDRTRIGTMGQELEVLEVGEG